MDPNIKRMSTDERRMIREYSYYLGRMVEDRIITDKEYHDLVRRKKCLMMLERMKRSLDAE